MVFVCFANQRGRSPEQGESADDKTNFPKGEWWSLSAEHHTIPGTPTVNDKSITLIDLGTTVYSLGLSYLRGFTS